MFLILSKTQSRKQHLQNVASSFIRIGRLLEQGYPLEAALRFVQLHVIQTTSDQIDEVLVNLKEGHSVHEAFRSFDIPASIKSFLYFYDHQGNLAQGFTHAGTLLVQRQKVLADISKLLRYPLVLIFFCALVLLLMFQFVIPHFRSFFTMMNDTPPLLTQVFFSFVNHLPYIVGGCLVILVPLILYLIVKFQKLSPYQRTMKLMSVPFCNGYVKTVITYIFALQLGKFISTGMSLQQSLLQFQKQDYLPFLQQECIQISHELHQGQSFQEILYNKVYLRTELTYVVDNGERTGYLGNDLEQYSEILFLELEEDLKKGFRLVQPILFLFVGGFVFLLFLATMLPLFQMVGSL
ncbi:competence type IV pilus assembly protein ComGB [Halalkalibacter kiskunsagensis]|uniref:Competence type IV pilus assembly protein ComGB n=1 Tax=Halalkalibacter kiskunsagensis TaxID=1548599 RepID=A0ABV6K878_9BACI